MRLCVIVVGDVTIVFPHQDEENEGAAEAVPKGEKVDDSPDIPVSFTLFHPMNPTISPYFTR